MNAESVSFLLIALGILGTHGATLRLLAACKRELALHIGEADQRQALSSQNLEEIVRIGADVADSLEGLIAGMVVQDGAGQPVITRPASIQDTIVQLMLDRFLPSEHASQSEERPIHIEHQTEKENDNDQSESA